MKRLVDRDFSRGSLEAAGADLIRAAGPYRPPAGAKARVRARLIATPPQARRRWNGILAVAAAALLLAGVAGALVGGRWHRTVDAQPAAVHRPGREPKQAPAPTRRIVRGPEATRAASSAGAPGATSARAAAPVVSAPTTGQRRSRPPATAGGDADEAALLYNATRSLRRDADAQTAGRALDEYFAKYPNGVLGEEALALAIEASVASGDGRAPALARQYLARYPNGHFRPQAQRALRGK